MAFRIEKAVVRGELSNEERGQVTGRVWLAGRAEPLTLRLSGNCLRDLAGCRLVFRNPKPEPEGHLDSLRAEQHGACGEITASRKVRVPAVSEDEMFELMEKDQPVPCRIANCLYLEWYSRANGRVLIESVDFELEVSTPVWSMTENEEEVQLHNSQAHFHEFIDAITGDDGLAGGGTVPGAEGAEENDALLAADEDDEDDEEEDEDEDDDEVVSVVGEDELFEAEGEFAAGDPLDEFEWEQELRDADRRAEAYQEAFEKYKDHPDRERLIAEALGWDDDDDDDDDDDSEVFEADDDMVEWAGPDAADGEPHHPLSQRAMDFALTLQREAEERGLMGESAEPKDNLMLCLILHIISLGGKLAGALDGWAQGLTPDPGFIIAMLKRAQVPLNEGLHAFDCIQSKSLSDDTRQWLQTRKRELFDLRREILDLMHQLRAN